MLINNDRKFNEQLDLDAAEREKLHQEELARAALEHERIRQSAERERQRLALEEERQRQQREEEEKRELDRLRQEKVQLEIASQKRQLEQRKQEEEQRRQAAEHARQLAETDARIKAQKEKDEADQKRRVDQAESDRKAREAAAAADKAKSQQAQLVQQLQQHPPQPPQQVLQPSTGPATSGTSSVAPPRSVGTSPLQSTVAEREANHQKYLDLHKRLKEFRSNMVAMSKQHPTLKGKLGDARRDLRTRTGQITNDRTAHTKSIGKIREVFQEAISAGGPTVDIRSFIIPPYPSVSNEREAQYSAFLLYLLNQFAKILISQFIGEASNEGKTIDSIGLIGISIFADDQFKWKGVSLIDVLMAKYHAVCPVLFGIYGRETTQRGKERLGWARTEAGGPFVTTNVHNERMLGLGYGYAALSLRIYKNKVPPLPSSEYWRALACIINTPSADITSTHLIVLKGMVQETPEKFIQLFGQAAIAALRMAVIDVPARAPPTASEAANMLRVIADVWKRDLHLTLE